jgi:hypothetical protein
VDARAIASEEAIIMHLWQQEKSAINTHIKISLSEIIYYRCKSRHNMNADVS